MAEATFDKVWFLPRERRWGELNLAYEDIGRLIVRPDSLEFLGRKGTLQITNIRSVSCGKQGRDFINDWVKIEYGEGPEPSTTFFADGAGMGWSGVLGGTQKILEAVQGTLRQD